MSRDDSKQNFNILCIVEQFSTDMFMVFFYVFQLKEHIS